MTTLFFSYSHKDEALRDQLETHLSLMKRQGLIDVWHDRRIIAGDEFDDIISTELESADVILLLISSDFLASNYCYSKEMTRAMVRHRAGEARVIPIILRTCDWHSAPFGKLTAAPRDGKPVTSWPDRDEAFTDVAKQVRTAVESMSRGIPTVKTGDTNSPPAALVAQHDKGGAAPNWPFGAPRSSNLRLKKAFNDLDRDRFAQESFEFIARFFEASIAAIKERNPGVEGNVERIDSRRFAAVLYRDGKAIAQCSIQLGGPGGFADDLRSITFAFGNASRGAYNEQLTVHATDQDLYLKPLGLTSYSNLGEKQLSAEGGAEMFWGLFIARAQG